MTEEEYRIAAMDVAYLAACAADGRRPDPARVAGMDLTTLYKAADRHLLTGITAMALESAGVSDEAFRQSKGKAVRKAAAFDIERAAVLAKLEEAGIWYMPLKGCLLKEYYPRLGMRQMSDNDILFDASRSRDVRAVMEGLGFKTVLFTEGRYGQDCYEKAPVCSFEMHRALFDPMAGETLFRYYQDVREKLVKDENSGWGYRFSPEDFYVFMIAHEYKHYSTSGTGLRSLLDTFVYLRKEGGTLDWAYIGGELDKLGLTAFEARNRSLAAHLFRQEELTAEDRELLEQFLRSGVYGTSAARIKNDLRKYGTGPVGKTRYFLRRVFMPMESVRAYFPRFAKYPILLPLLPAYRLIRGLTVRRDRLRAEIRALTKRGDPE